MNCPGCGVIVEDVGITVRVFETRVYMREGSGKDLVLVETLDRPQLDAVLCRNCLGVLPVQAVEGLRLIA